MAGKIQIPDTLKSDLPEGKWGKILAATPIVMTVVATALAGLASSEMTHAQYDRALAAQLQSKAGDQWGFFQAKKMRSAMQHDTLDILQTVAPFKPVEDAALAGQPAAVVAALQQGDLPAVPDLALEAHVKTALEAFETAAPENQIAAVLGKTKPADLAVALKSAQDRVLAFDAAAKPILKAVDQLEKASASSRDFTAARLRVLAARYDTEARLNQTVAGIYELQVRQGNLSAERHHRRSGRFFYGMLVAQMGVIISTFAMAARKRSFLWSVAAAAGLTAISFAAYVYLCM
jgi:Domain of unknown function (DUF4337)